MLMRLLWLLRTALPHSEKHQQAPGKGVTYTPYICFSLLARVANPSPDPHPGVRDFLQPPSGGVELRGAAGEFL
jgi:hypothetical protein